MTCFHINFVFTITKASYSSTNCWISLTAKANDSLNLLNHLINVDELYTAGRKAFCVNQTKNYWNSTVINMLRQKMGSRHSPWTPRLHCSRCHLHHWTYTQHP